VQASNLYTYRTPSNSLPPKFPHLE